MYFINISRFRLNLLHAEDNDNNNIDTDDLDVDNDERAKNNESDSSNSDTASDKVQSSTAATEKAANQKSKNNKAAAHTKNGVKWAAATVGTKGGNQTNLNEFFKVQRRSVRKTKTELEREEQLALEKAILEDREDGMAIKTFDNKGRGIVATRPFARGEFVVEYVGDFIPVAEAKQREQVYATIDNAGCYMYYFKHSDKQYCIDATKETGKLGRLVNHSRNGNLVPKAVIVKNSPHLVFLAKVDIVAGTELTYDYGDRSKVALENHPWLAF